MRWYFLTFILFSFESYSIMCGSPNYIEKAPSGSTVLIGEFDSIVKSYIETESSEVLAKGKDTSYPVAVVRFINAKAIKGTSKESFYAKFITNGGMNNWFPKPPDITGSYYLFSFKPGAESGSLSEPFLVGPCNLYKRI